MYTLIRESLPIAGAAVRQPRFKFARPVSMTVVLLGLTSMFTDVSSEMVTTVLPLFFIFNIGLTPLSFGVIDGLHQGVSAPLRIFGGYLADRFRLHKEAAMAGYGLSAICKLGLLAFSGAVMPFIGMLLLDRTGKGLRSAPRDAMISLSTPRESLGLAFGVHRALDTAGALAGPLLAFALLRLIPGGFDVIFAVSFCMALIGFSVISLLVEAPGSSTETPVAARPPSPKAALRLAFDPRFRRLSLVASGLSLFTISDAFYYLVLQRRLDLDLGFFPLLYVGSACSYLLLAVPAGLLADRVGRRTVFAGGYVLLLLAYTSLLRSGSSPLEVGVYLVLFGAYYAATDGVLIAMASASLPDDLRATGIAALTTVTSLARFGGSVLFGLMWTWQGDTVAIAMLLAGLAAAIFASIFIPREGERVRAGQAGSR